MDIKLQNQIKMGSRCSITVLLGILKVTSYFMDETKVWKTFHLKLKCSKL